MSRSQQAPVSKGLLTTLVLVVVAGAIYFAYNAMNSGEPKVEGNVPQVPNDIKPVPENEKGPTVDMR
jgi:hypothetical protein